MHTHKYIYIGIDFCDFRVLRVSGYVLFGNMVFKIHELNSIGISFFSVFIHEKENHKQPCRRSCALVIIRSILVSCMSLAELATKGLFLPWTTSYSSSPCKSREGNSPKLAWLGTPEGPNQPPPNACMHALYIRRTTQWYFMWNIMFPKDLSCLTGFITIFDKFGTFWTSLQVAPQMYSYI